MRLAGTSISVVNQSAASPTTSIFISRISRRRAERSSGLASAKYMRVIHLAYNEYSPDTSCVWGVFVSATWGRFWGQCCYSGYMFGPRQGGEKENGRPRVRRSFHRQIEQTGLFRAATCRRRDNIALVFVVAVQPIHTDRDHDKRILFTTGGMTDRDLASLSWC